MYSMVTDMFKYSDPLLFTADCLSQPSACFVMHLLAYDTSIK